MFPPWPGLDGLHPLVIHFPIGLLLVAPALIACAVVSQKHRQGFSLSALILLALGTAAIYVAVESGEAAAELASRTDAINAVISRHSELAESAQMLFTVLTVLYAAAVWLPRWVKALARPAVVRSLNVVLLVAILGGSLLIANVAHLGGRLVHQYGVHAMVSAD